MVIFVALLVAVATGCERTGCSGHGECQTDVCVCDEGWLGVTCGMEQLRCNGELCNGRGVCAVAGESFVCHCEVECGWEGPGCELCPGECLQFCVQVPKIGGVGETPGPGGDSDSIPWWLPLVILVPVAMVLVVSGVLLRSVMQLRTEAKIKKYAVGGGGDNEETAPPQKKVKKATVNRKQLAFETFGDDLEMDGAQSSPGKVLQPWFATPPPPAPGAEPDAILGAIPPTDNVSPPPTTGLGFPPPTPDTTPFQLDIPSPQVAPPTPPPLELLPPLTETSNAADQENDL